MTQRLERIFRYRPAHLLLGVHLKNIGEALSIDAEATDGEHILADDEACGVNAASYTCHVRHHNFLIASSVQIETHQVVLEISDCASLATLTLLLASKDIN